LMGRDGTGIRNSSGPIYYGRYCNISGPQDCGYTNRYMEHNGTWCYCVVSWSGTLGQCTGECITNCVDSPIYGNVCSTYTACQDDYGWRCN
jgi:hypothetical protein